MSESRSGRPGLPIPNNPYGLRGRKAALNAPALTMRSGSSAARRAVQKTCISKGYKYKCISNLCSKTASPLSESRRTPSGDCFRSRTILRIFTTEVTLGHEIESEIGHGIDLSEPGYRGVTR